ncbi:MAG: endonuclease III [Ignavibacteria bacterium]|nr:endonuclease III [Ignavibacteria bacterium]
MKKLGIFVLKVNSRLLEHFGKPKRKLDSKPLDILIATILSQNTSDKNSLKAYHNLRKKFPAWADIKKASISQLARTIRIAGLSRQKAKTIKELFKWLVNINQHYSLGFLNDLSNEEVLSELTKLQGIGVKTASCVLLFGMQRNVCPVDTHVFRTVNRIGIVSGSTPEKTFYALDKILPYGIAHEFHTNLIILGRTICKPKKPECFNCPLVKLCNFKKKNLTSDFSSASNRRNDIILLDAI